jgi:hypothetical protein
MHSEMKAKWIEALRSGKYEQGFAQLKTNDNKYCCLGVLCDLDEETSWGTSTLMPGTFNEMNVNAYMNQINFLPEKLRTKYEIMAGDEKVLIELNDGGFSFEKIADYIEEYM